MTLKVSTTGYEKTVALGAQVGEKLRGNEMIELVSDVGGGKTAFTTGLAQGAGSHNEVSSPSFTINQIYAAPSFEINHYDFYRLAEPGIMQLELDEAIHDPQTVVVVEWGDSVEDVLPQERLKVHIATTGENDREITFSAPESLHYLLADIDEAKKVAA